MMTNLISLFVKLSLTRFMNPTAYMLIESSDQLSELNISERYLNKDPKWMSIQARLSDILTVSAKSYINYLDVGP
ncbi:MAG: hypothetical protein CM15mV10_1360 [uncultured marine virus]|nr:MAG: hypothetical protein CM15mV10_1360 [uncultured marine virus]